MTRPPGSASLTPSEALAAQREERLGATLVHAFRVVARLTMVSFTMFAAVSAVAKPSTRRGGDAYRATVERRLREVSPCYEVALSQTGVTSGKIALVWSVDDKGSAVDVRTDPSLSTTADDALRFCLSEKLQRWRFPPSPKGRLKAASYIFTFSK